MIINACFIVKDDSEVKKLHRAVYSVINFVDGVYITANGKETKLIEAYCKENPKIHYSYIPFKKDFSEVRNFNFSQVPKGTDFIFWMDTDDILVGGPKLREIAEQAKQMGRDLVFFTYWYGCSFNGDPSVKNLKEVEMQHMRERLIRPNTHVWKGRLHETPVPVDGLRNNYTKYPFDEKERPVAIMHTASLEEAEEKMKRNREILELQLEDERKRKEGADPRTLLYLMKIYAEEDDKSVWPKVIEMGREYLTKSGWDEERGVCNEQMGIVSGKMGDHKTAAEYYHAAIGEWCTQPLWYIRLAVSYYNLKNYRASKHWLDIASKMEMNDQASNMSNFKGMKSMFAELTLKLAHNVEKDTQKALQAAMMLYQEIPNEMNKKQVEALQDLNDLNEACRSTHSVANYLHSIGDDKAIIRMLDALPDAISTQKFAIDLRKSAAPSRKWGRNEICYFANFGGKHFEKWDSSSLDKGVGGSETAVINMAKEWTKLGYKVTVYGDPFRKGEQDGVTYLPWYYFNWKDYFNIFIEWRGWQLAGKVKARKFYVDLHDIYTGVDFNEEHLRNIDKIMVKSMYHRKLGGKIPDDKFLIVSNGI